MWDKNSNYLRIETGFAFPLDISDELVNKSNNQIFTRGMAVLKINYYNPKNLIVQHLPFKEQVSKIEFNRIRTSYIVDDLMNVDFHEIYKIGGEVIQTHEGVI